MRTFRFSKLMLLTGLVTLLVAGGLLVHRVFAQPSAEQTLQASPLHPVFALLDANGADARQSGEPLSTMKTCGECHDTTFIASHSFHTDLGLSSQAEAGTVPGGKPWDTSTGMYGKWSPLTYRYLSQEGDKLIDMTQEDWVRLNADRLVGGGPAAASGMEMNCFLCHLTQPNNAERMAAVEAGKAEWANTATLVGSGIVNGKDGVYQWNQAAFTEDGKLDQAFVTLQDPSNANCGQCHGVVHSDPEQVLTLTGCELDNGQSGVTGQVMSAQKISLSGMNLADKSSLARSWDIHIERGLSCTDCHYSLNNPAYYQVDSAEKPSHLEFDPRRLEIGEFLEKPDHNFARGQSAQYTIAPELKGTMRRCESCHDSSTHADWLPYVERHMAEIACETCHVPQLYAPAVQSYDWTVLQADGEPANACRGVEETVGDVDGSLNDLVTGFQPVLLQRNNIDGETTLAPYNLVSSWYWVYRDPAGLRPVRLEDLQAAWFENDSYAPEVLAVMDTDSNGTLSDLELRLDTADKQAVIAGRLAALGLVDPHIEGQVQPYSINHNVTRGEYVTRECQSCHSDDSRLSASMTLAEYLPGGVMPEFVRDTNVLVTDGLAVEDGALVFAPSTSDQGLYVFGHNRVSWIDWFGGLFFVGVLAAVAGHGGLRFYRVLRRPHAAQATRRVYMYSVYERFWHWLQTFTIVLLLFTGLIIHRPDLFGWLSFPYMVTIHNVLAAILVINAGLSLFYHLVSGEIQQFIPRPYGFFDQAIVQAKYYLQGIFKGGAHPFEKTPQKKLNPLQQVTYFGILNVLLPLQIITGALMWGVQQWPQAASMLGGLPFLAPFHSLVAWTFGAFIVGHVYLTTTGHEALGGIKAMMNGWEKVESGETPVYPPEDEGTETAVGKDSSAAQPAAS